MIDSIFIKSIPMSEMRYKTCGDWWYDPDGTLQIRAAKMGDWRYELLVAVQAIKNWLGWFNQKTHLEVTEMPNGIFGGNDGVPTLD